MQGTHIHHRDPFLQELWRKVTETHWGGGGERMGRGKKVAQCNTKHHTKKKNNKKNKLMQDDWLSDHLWHKRNECLWLNSEHRLILTEPICSNSQGGIFLPGSAEMACIFCGTETSQCVAYVGSLTAGDWLLSQNPATACFSSSSNFCKSSCIYPLRQCFGFLY